jgi:Rrf2 family protein
MKAQYALRALMAMVREGDQGNFCMQDLSEAAQVPAKFLEQILLQLKRGGLLRSKRGLGGGYQLQRAAARITLGEVINLLDGPFEPFHCSVAAGGCAQGEAAPCGLCQTFGLLKQQVDGWLATTTLAQVLERERRQSPSFDI